MADNNSVTANRPLPAAERYPWHDELWSTLTRQMHRLPHALLLHGRPGLGKHAFAVRLAQTLLCAQPQAGAACGKCHGCQLFAAGTHPDMSVVGPLEDAKTITIDQIRALGEFLSLRPHTATRKVVIISPAEIMNLNAANGLLKLLEEPPLGSVLFLVTSHPARLPATIRSRCSRILFKPPARAEGLTWLQSQAGGGTEPHGLLELAGGAPLLAQVLVQEGFLEDRAKLIRDLAALRAGREDPVACAARWKSLGAGLCLGWLYSFVSDLIKIRMGARESGLTNPEAVVYEDEGTFKFKINMLYNFIDVIHEYHRQLGGPLDELLMLEDVLIRWVRLSRLQ